MSNEWNKIVSKNPLLYTLFVDNAMSDESESVYCRLCAENKPRNKMIDLELDDEKKCAVTNKLIKINALTDFGMETLPKTICLVCLSALEKAYTFVNNVIKAQNVLQNLLLVHNIKKEISNSDHESNDSYTLEPDEVKYEKIPIKKETTPERSHSKKNQVYKKPVRDMSLDAIPLSQLKLTWKDYTWTCAYCETQFPTVDELRNHSMQYHNCCNAYRCTDCNIRKLRLDSFMIHIKRHRKYLKLSCYKCFNRFTSIRETNIHNSKHITTSHFCPGCNTSFESVEAMTSHSSIYYIDKRSRQIPVVNVDDDGLTCMLCKKTFKYRGSLNTHLLTHTDRKRDHTCDKCGKCFLNKQNLAGHMLLHTDTRPFQCEICKQSFKTPQQLRNHVGVHDNQKPYSCDQCGRCFRLQKQLVSHSIIHTDLLPYVCSYCNKSFRFKTILNQHIRQHTGVKPYSCEICQRDFTNWPNYNKHMKRRHSMDMAKKKHTPDGVYPINPSTGEVIVYPETNKTLEWKKKMMTQRRPGRPRVPKVDEQTQKIEDMEVKKE
jgi:hypothetical protein